jgi:hypothetical protein
MVVLFRVCSGKLGQHFRRKQFLLSRYEVKDYQRRIENPLEGIHFLCRDRGHITVQQSNRPTARAWITPHRVRGLPPADCRIAEQDGVHIKSRLESIDVSHCGPQRFQIVELRNI